MAIGYAGLNIYSWVNILVRILLNKFSVCSLKFLFQRNYFFLHYTFRKSIQMPTKVKSELFLIYNYTNNNLYILLSGFVIKFTKKFKQKNYEEITSKNKYLWSRIISWRYPPYDRWSPLNKIVKLQYSGMNLQG